MKKVNISESTSEKRLIWLWIVFVTVIYFLLTFFSQDFIYSDSIYYRSYSSTITQQSIENMLGLQSRFWWASYILIPIVLIFKFALISVCVSIGKVFSDMNIEFKQIFRATVFGEWIFIIAQITFTTILYLNLDDITLQNASGYFPLSALSFIGIENVNAQWAIYPLQTANLFEVFYMIAIAWFLSKMSKQSFADVFSVVLPSYGLGLLLWITLVAFLTFQVT